MVEAKRTPLYDVHRELGARMASFGGWEMPIEYSGIVREHTGVRTEAGLFDTSHMGEIFVRGSGAGELLQRMTSNDIGKLSAGRAQYSALPSEKGTVIDDVLVYQIRHDEFMLVVNAANIERDWEWLRSQNTHGAELENASEETAMLAIQGPRSAAIVSAIARPDPAGLGNYEAVHAQVGGLEGLLSRTGYTGEDGFEFYCHHDHVRDLWPRVVQAGTPLGMLPSGLGARNTLRLEAGLLLHGSDMDETTTFGEAGLSRIVKLDKGPFVGREALMEESRTGPPRRLSGFQMLGTGVARDGYTVLIDGKPGGRVTSGSPSITLGRNIGFAYLPSGHSVPGTRFEVQIRQRRVEAVVVETPFYRRRTSS